jgi:hypothetical protein
MLEAIPMEPNWMAIFLGLAAVAVAVTVGFLLSRREVKEVDPADVLGNR